MNYLNIFSSAVVLKEVESVEDEVDSTIVKSVQSEYFTECKIEKNSLPELEIPKENHLQYVRFNNECEFNNGLNGKTNGDYDYESSSNTSSSESITFRKIVLTPIEENEIKLSSGYDNCAPMTVFLSMIYIFLFQNETD